MNVAPLVRNYIIPDRVVWVRIQRKTKTNKRKKKNELASQAPAEICKFWRCMLQKTGDIRDDASLSKTPLPFAAFHRPFVYIYICV